MCMQEMATGATPFLAARHIHETFRHHKDTSSPTGTSQHPESMTAVIPIVLAPGDPFPA